MLHAFGGNEDGAYPQDGAIMDGPGNLYGTTFYGETEQGGCCYGQVYAFDASTGTKALSLPQFDNGCAEA